MPSRVAHCSPLPATKTGSAQRCKLMYDTGCRWTLLSGCVWLLSLLMDAACLPQNMLGFLTQPETWQLSGFHPHI